MRGAPPDWLHDLGEDLMRVARVVVPPLLLFAVIITIATAGYICLGWDEFDALYMVVITVFSVGYDEAVPVDTVAERVWTMLVIVGGWTGVFMTLGGIVKWITEGELRRVTGAARKLRAVQHLHDHTVICGYGRMGQTLARELSRAGLSFVVVDSSPERAAQIETDGFRGWHGDATDEAVLRSIGVERARTLATVLPQDAHNVYITLTARELAPDIRIIARGEQLSTEKKLRQAGADEVILPATIGALRIAHSITEPAIMSLLHEGADQVDWHRLGLEVDELELRHHAHLLGKSVTYVHLLAPGELMILGVRRDGVVLRENLQEVVLQEGDALLALAREGDLPLVLGRELERTELL